MKLCSLALAAMSICGWMATPVVAQPALTWSTAGMTATRPALSYYRDGKGMPLLTMTCGLTSIRFQVKGFVAAQQWPQPALTIAVGAAARSKVPDARWFGDQTGLETEFQIADSILDPIRKGVPIQALFNGQETTFPVAPEAMLTEFADKCAALVLPAMRAG